MAEELDMQIKITADPAGVEAGVTRAKRSLASLSQSADQTGEQGARGLGKLGGGGDALAQGLDRTTRSMVTSLQRQIAAIQAGGTANRQYQESLARLRGADIPTLKPFLDQLDAAKAKAEAADRAQGGLIDRLGGVGSVASIARGQLAALAGSFTLGAIFAFVKSVNDGVDALNDIKDATGATIENISALEEVGKRTGATLDTVGSVLIKFNDVLTKATPKSDTALQLEAIGLSAMELRKLDPAEALRVTAVALAGYADDANKARLIQDLFGKSVKEAAPFLTDLAEQGQLVAKVTTLQAEEAERFNKELFALQANASEAARSLTGPLVKAINDTAKAFRDGRAAGKGFFEIAGARFNSNLADFMGTAGTTASGGATGSWDEPEAARPSIKPGKTAAEIAAEAAAAKRAGDDQRRQLADQAKLIAELNGLNGSFYDDWARLSTMFARGALSVQQLTKAQADLLAKQPAIKAATDAAAKSALEYVKATVAAYQAQEEGAAEIAQAYVAQSKAREQGALAIVNYTRGIQETNAAAEFELSLLGLSTQAREKAVAQYRIQLELARQLEAIDANPGFSAGDRDIQSGRARAAAGSAIAGLDNRQALDALKELDAYLDPARAQDFGSALRDAFGEAGNALAQLTNSFQAYAQEQAEHAKMQAALRDSAGKIDQAEYFKREQDLAKKSAQSQIGSYASIAGAAKGFFGEHSKGYKAMEAAEKGFRLMEMGMALQSMTQQLFKINAVTTATVAGESLKTAAIATGTGTQIAADLAKGTSAAAVGVATQAQGDPYTALPRMAIMAAAMAALGFAVGGFGGGGGGGAATREARQAAQGTGTVFGDSSAKSGSIGDAFEALEDSARIELRYQSGMLASLRNIEDSMAGVANAVLRTTGITSGNAPGVFEGVLSTNKGDPIMNAIGLGSLGGLASSLPLIGGVIGKLQSLWGKTKQEITDSGLVINGVVANLEKGVGFGQYTDVTTTKSSFFGLSKSSRNSTIFGDLDESTNEALSRVFRNLSTTLQAATGPLGRDAAQVGQQIAATLIDIPRVSLRDLKGDDLKEAISSTISAAADTIASTVSPGLEAFQQVGEGYFETIVRVSSGVESADYALERFGITAIGYSALFNKQGDVAAEIFRDSVAAFEGAGTGIATILQGVSGAVDDLSDTYTGLVAVRNSLKSVGANGFDPSFDLLRGAGGLEGLQDGLDAYLENYFSDTEQFTAASARLSEQFARIGVPQPADAAAFRALATGLDLSQAASAQLFGRLMNVADAFFEISSAVRESERALQSAFDDVAPAWLDGDALRRYRATRISEGLADTGLSISPEQILGASADQFKAMYYAIDKTTMSGRAQATALLGMWGAFEEMNQAAADAAADAAKAAAEIVRAWQGVTDSIVAEIKRIRGEITGTMAGGFAGAQSLFAIATSQARAGDQAAATSLPELSRTVLQLARDNAASAAELKTFQAQIAASLEDTTRYLAASQGVTVPAFAAGGTHTGGWAMVGERGPELAYMPPAQIYTAADTAGMMGGNGALVAEVRALREDNRLIAGDLARLHLRVAKATEGAARTLEDVTEGGAAMRTAAT
jgi:hypothetical protein